tara:strand:- start:2 stop:589 length:588 start_codon:yes stop_codon:yes gene_type:complete
MINNFSKKISINVYMELFSHKDYYNPSSYSEYNALTKKYVQDTDYIKGIGNWVNEKGQSMPVYSDNIIDIKEGLSYVDPNMFLELFPQYNSIVGKIILKWNYKKGSNLYIVYSNQKILNEPSMVGICSIYDSGLEIAVENTIDNPDKCIDENGEWLYKRSNTSMKRVFQFNDRAKWTDLLRDQTIMIKIDYWFEN